MVGSLVAVVLLQLASQSDSPPRDASSVGLTLELFTDQEKVKEGHICHVLVELRNDAQRPLWVPTTDWIEQHLELQVVGPDGAPFDIGGTFSTTSADLVELSPGHAVHTQLYPISRARIASVDRPMIVTVSASLTVNTRQVLAATQPNARGASNEQAVIKSNGVVFTIVPSGDEQSVSGPSPELALARQFIGGVVSRSERQRIRSELTVLASSGKANGAQRRYLAELDEMNLDVRMGEIDEFLSTAGQNPLSDDVCFTFALLSAWDSSVPGREAMLLRLVKDRPGSTGARQASQYLLWGEEYRATVRSW